MTDNYYDTLADVRLERADELIAEAKRLLEDGSYKSANNRAYYAMEKAVNALLIHSHIEAKTHNGSMTLFNVNFVRTENPFFSAEDYRLLAKAEQIRNASDYDDFYVANKAETVKVVQNSEYIVNKIRQFLVSFG